MSLRCPLALCCFEPARQPCQRRAFARWWQERTGEKVPEADRVLLH
jgi:hypothetical protein